MKLFSNISLSLSFSGHNQKADPEQADTLCHGTADPLGDGEEGDLHEEVVLLAQQGQAHLVMGDLLGVEEGQLVQLYHKFVPQQ